MIKLIFYKILNIMIYNGFVKEVMVIIIIVNILKN